MIRGPPPGVNKSAASGRTANDGNLTTIVAAYLGDLQAITSQSAVRVDSRAKSTRAAVCNHARAMSPSSRGMCNEGLLKPRPLHRHTNAPRLVGGPPRACTRQSKQTIQVQQPSMLYNAASEANVGMAVSSAHSVEEVSCHDTSCCRSEQDNSLLEEAANARLNIAVRLAEQELEKMQQAVNTLSHSWHEQLNRVRLRLQREERGIQRMVEQQEAYCARWEDRRQEALRRSAPLRQDDFRSQEVLLSELGDLREKHRALLAEQAFEIQAQRDALSRKESECTRLRAKLATTWASSRSNATRRQVACLRLECLALRRLLRATSVGINTSFEGI